MNAAASGEIDYGFRKVGLDEKQGLVDGVFDHAARRYDVMNDLMSGGLHRLWKDAMISWLAPPRRPAAPWRALDLAGGTGDIGFRILDRSGDRAEVTISDINPSMLDVGRRRAERRGYGARLSFLEANAEELPVESGRYDAVTIAFGIRNVPRRERALAEAFRALKPGGRFLCLEFSAVDVPVLDRLYDFYSFRVIPPMAKVVTGDGEPYRYLVESIRTFPNPDRFAAMMEDAGFDRVEYRLLSGGIAAVHSGAKT